METLAQPPVSDPEPPPATPYFLRRAAFAAEVRAEVARRSSAMTAVRAIADAPDTPVVLRLAPGPGRRWQDAALCAEVDPDLLLPRERRLDPGSQAHLPRLRRPRRMPGLRRRA